MGGGGDDWLTRTPILLLAHIVFIPSFFCIMLWVLLTLYVSPYKYFSYAASTDETLFFYISIYVPKSSFQIPLPQYYFVHGAFCNKRKNWTNVCVSPLVSQFFFFYEPEECKKYTKYAVNLMVVLRSFGKITYLLPSVLHKRCFLKATEISHLYGMLFIVSYFFKSLQCLHIKYFPCQ